MSSSEESRKFNASHIKIFLTDYFYWFYYIESVFLFKNNILTIDKIKIT
jgi:hypothetical protein